MSKYDSWSKDDLAWKCRELEDKIEKLEAKLRKYESEKYDLENVRLKRDHPEPLDYQGDGYDMDGNLVYDTAICRNCGRYFEVDYDEHSNYCPNCGQALDWEEGYK